MKQKANINDGEHRPPTSNAVYDALTEKVGVATALNVDLNTLQTTGVYECSRDQISAEALHYPIDDWGTLVVLKINRNGKFQQIYYNDSVEGFYIRKYNEGFGSWYKYVSNGTTETGTLLDDSDAYIGYARVGKVILFNIYAKAAFIGNKTIPFNCAHVGEGQKCSMLWAGNCLGEAYLINATTIKINCSAESSGELVCILE